MRSKSPPDGFPEPSYEANARRMSFRRHLTKQNPAGRLPGAVSHRGKPPDNFPEPSDEVNARRMSFRRHLTKQTPAGRLPGAAFPDAGAVTDLRRPTVPQSVCGLWSAAPAQGDEPAPADKAKAVGQLVAAVQRKNNASKATLQAAQALEKAAGAVEQALIPLEPD